MVAVETGIPQDQKNAGRDLASQLLENNRSLSPVLVIPKERLSKERMLCGPQPDSHLCFVAVGGSVSSGLYLCLCSWCWWAGIGLVLTLGDLFLLLSLVFSCSSLKNIFLFSGIPPRSTASLM